MAGDSNFFVGDLIGFAIGPFDMDESFLKGDDGELFLSGATLADGAVDIFGELPDGLDIRSGVRTTEV